MSDKDLKYGEMTYKARESYVNRFRAELNKNMTDSAQRLVKLIERVPHWETYLTSKQLEAAQRYIKTCNAYEVDYQLKLTPGTTHQRLFGNKTSSGAIGRLERASKMLEDSGFFQTSPPQPEPKQAVFSEKLVERASKLLNLADELHDYDKFLSVTQTCYLTEFIRSRNVTACAKILGISEAKLVQALLGEDGSGSILDRLKQEQNSRMAQTWEEL